ncbi:MAG: maleylacetoacetate isomerase [Rhodobacterales bacterium]|nr:maleylacetoacetate isomerase [Rhodobacterales bacterium]
MKLYTYYRSSAAYRVRIALNLKGIACEQVGVHLVKDGGQHRTEAYAAINPLRLVPSLEDGGRYMTQSLALLEYLEDTHPTPPLLPADAFGRARVRALCLSVACEIHPLNNLRALGYLTGTLGVDEDAKMAWYHHWIHEGFRAIETLLTADAGAGTFCHGDSPTLADCCLVPQVYNAHRFGVDIGAYPTIRRIEAACLALPAFDAARPENQPDAD